MLMRRAHAVALAAGVFAAACAPAASGSTTVTGSSGAPAAPEALTHAQPPVAGTYRYQQTTNGNASVVTVNASVPQPSGDGTSDSLTEHIGPGTLGRTPETVVYVEHWDATGTHLTTLTVGGPDGPTPCVLNAPIPVLDYSPAVGDHWSGTGQCTANGTTLLLQESDRITGTAWMPVGAHSVPCLVISVTRLTSYPTADGAVRSAFRSTSWFAPSLGLVVRDESTTTSDTPSGITSSWSVLLMDSIYPS